MDSALLARLSSTGLGVFLLIYLYASTLYNGGSKVNPHQKSWDWINNFWCDLLWPTTILGLPNRTAKWGITANFVLCGSIICFYLAFAQVYAPSPSWQSIIAIFGVLSMLFAMLIFTPLHDRIMIFILGSALPAIVGVIYGLVYFDKESLLYWGAIALVLIVINVCIFYSHVGERYLPLWQKIAFVSVLFWVFMMNWKLM